MNRITKTVSIGLLSITPFFVGCQAFKETNYEFQKFLQEELGEYPSARKSNSKKIMRSENMKDYILADGSGIAIPCKHSFQLYISPFAPYAGYIRSFEKPGQIIICPYTGRKLIIGNRKKIAEMELP